MDDSRGLRTGGETFNSLEMEIRPSQDSARYNETGDVIWGTHLTDNDEKVREEVLKDKVDKG